MISALIILAAEALSGQVSVVHLDSEEVHAVERRHDLEGQFDVQEPVDDEAHLKELLADAVGALEDAQPDSNDGAGDERQYERHRHPNDLLSRDPLFALILVLKQAAHDVEVLLRNSGLNEDERLRHWLFLQAARLDPLEEEQQLQLHGTKFDTRL